MLRNGTEENPVGEPVCGDRPECASDDDRGEKKSETEILLELRNLAQRRGDTETEPDVPLRSDMPWVSAFGAGFRGSAACETSERFFPESGDCGWRGGFNPY
jgi:hypothetical protein